jgi:adenylate cyclase
MSDPSRKIYQIYLERIAALRGNSPGEGWDGVFTFTTK